MAVSSVGSRFPHNTVHYFDNAQENLPLTRAWRSSSRYSTLGGPDTHCCCQPSGSRSHHRPPCSAPRQWNSSTSQPRRSRTGMAASVGRRCPVARQGSRGRSATSTHARHQKGNTAPSSAGWLALMRCSTRTAPADCSPRRARSTDPRKLSPERRRRCRARSHSHDSRGTSACPVVRLVCTEEAGRAGLCC